MEDDSSPKPDIKPLSIQTSDFKVIERKPIQPTNVRPFEGNMPAKDLTSEIFDTPRGLTQQERLDRLRQKRKGA